jgi:uncharacterized membrane protein
VRQLSERTTLSTSPASALMRPRGVWLMLVVAAVSGSVLVMPYLLFDVDASRVSPRNELHWVLLLVHVFTAMVALVLGPLQFLPTLRARRRVHRAIGRGYLFAGVLPSALAGLPVAALSERPATQIGLLIPGVAWLVTGGFALRAARRRDFAAHEAWMMRNYALTFLAVTSRVVVPLLLLAQVPIIDGVYDGSVDAAVEATIPVGQWLGWITNLIIAEILIHRKVRAPHSRSGAISQIPKLPRPPDGRRNRSEVGGSRVELARSRRDRAATRTRP